MGLTITGGHFRRSTKCTQATKSQAHSERKTCHQCDTLLNKYHIRNLSILAVIARRLRNAVDLSCSLYLRVTSASRICIKRRLHAPRCSRDYAQAALIDGGPSDVASFQSGNSCIPRGKLAARLFIISLSRERRCLWQREDQTRRRPNR